MPDAGRPPGRKRKDPPRRGMRLLADAAEEAVRPLLRRRGFRETALVRRWHHIIGPQFARRTAPVSLTRGTLTVRVDSAFATEFQHRSAMVLDRIATTFGERVAQRIVIRQGPVCGRWPPDRPRPASTAPTGEIRRTAQVRTAGVRNESLRTALAGLAAAMTVGHGERRDIETAHPAGLSPAEKPG